MRRRGSRLLPFWDPRFTTLRRSSLLIFWDSQLTSDHLTQARATLRPVRPSGRSPKQCCNLCIHLFSLRVPHESAHKVLNLYNLFLIFFATQNSCPTPPFARVSQRCMTTERVRPLSLALSGSSSKTSREREDWLPGTTSHFG